MNSRQLSLIIFILVLIAGFFYFDLGRFLDFVALKEQLHTLQAHVRDNPLRSGAIYFLIYVAVTGLSLPGAVPLTLIGGAAFGLLWATVLVSFASTLGATLAFLLSRYLFRDLVQSRFGHHLASINDGVRRDGAFYLFTLRLIPLFPFFVINVVMGLTSMRTLTYLVVSQLGMFPATVVFANAGTQLGQLESAAGIVSPGLLASFVLLGLFPLLARKLVDFIKAKKVYRDWPRPRSFDRNLIVLGAGSGGLVSAYIAAAVQAKVTLIERERMGGDCLNTGCVPSKALIRSARFVAQARDARALGIKSAQLAFDFAEIMERVQRVIGSVEPHDSVERYERLGVEVIRGEGRITSPWQVEVGGRTLTTRNIIVATGARPFVPPIAGVETVGYLTSDSIWSLRSLPQRLVVLGGGPIGCELAQAFARFGSAVTQVEFLDRLMVREDPEVSAQVEKRFRREGVDVRTGHRAVSFEVAGTEKILVCEHDGSEVRIPFDDVLIAVGRRANATGFGLEELGVNLRENGTVDADAFLRTNFPNIFVCGDVTGPYQFTHTASHQAWYAAVNALFGSLRRFRVDYSVIPWATFTDPEVARVGLNELEARERNVDYEVTTWDLGELDRAIADEAADGFIKVLTVPGKDRILGATIVGEHAGELITEFVSAMRHGLGLNKILGTIHIYPTFSEANKHVAGAWKRAHVSASVLRWLARYHRWKL